MKMNIQKILFFGFILFFTACSAQKSKEKTVDIIEVVKAQKGNTGFRGRVAREDMNKPNQGKDFYILEIKALRDCVFEVKELIISKNETQAIFLKIANDEHQTVFNLKKNDIIFLRAELNDSIKVITKRVLTFRTYPQLTLSINNKYALINIKKIEEILPN